MATGVSVKAPQGDLLRDRTALRVAVCTLVAVVAAHLGHQQVVHRLAKHSHSDLGQSWFAARAVLHGLDPYALIGPGLAFEWPAGWFYPLPAALVLTPIAPFSESIAVAIFSAVGAVGLAWALTTEGFGPLWAFSSACVIHAFEVGQWSPVLASAYAIAPLGLLIVAKPTVGAAVVAAKPTRWNILGGLLLLALAFVLQPEWMQGWQTALRGTNVGGGPIAYTAPITFPSGFLILLALLRWKRPEARLLAVLACVPQTALPYEGLFLFLIPRTWRESMFLAASSWAMLYYTRHSFDLTPGMSAALDAYGHSMVAFLYLPATIMVLRRPNEGVVPSFAWLRFSVRQMRDAL